MVNAYVAYTPLATGPPPRRMTIGPSVGSTRRRACDTSEYLHDA
jgi:hypothetical protein